MLVGSASLPSVSRKGHDIIIFIPIDHTVININVFYHYLFVLFP